MSAPAPCALPLIHPAFTSPRVGAVMTTRQGGVSHGAFEGLNLREGLGDDEADVRLNRQRLETACGVVAQRLQQVHGTAVQAVDALAPPQVPWPVADASVTSAAGLACEIQVADCLPVLFADRAGRAVGAAHAGWRGLAGGVLEATLAQVCERAGAAPGDIEAWLGPCIGPTAFEVGADVLAAFGATADAPGALFQPAGVSGGVPKWWGHLPGLARSRLQAAGVTAVSGNDGSLPWCTFSQPSRYFSFRRDRVTGRMAALIWLRA